MIPCVRSTVSENTYKPTFTLTNNASSTMASHLCAVLRLTGSQPSNLL